MTTKQLNVRLPQVVINDLNDLSIIYGSQAKAMIAAITSLKKEIEMSSKVVVIPQKISGTGTIHDVASQHYDRKITFLGDTKYAVVLADYYGGKGYTTHKTAEAAIKESNRQKEYSHMIVDTAGEWYRCDGYDLIPVASY